MKKLNGLTIPPRGLVALAHDVFHGVSEESEERLYELAWPTYIAEWTRTRSITKM